MDEGKRPQPNGEPSEPRQKEAKRRVEGIPVFTLIIISFVISIALCIGTGIETANVMQRYEALEQASHLASLCKDAVAQA